MNGRDTKPQVLSQGEPPILQMGEDVRSTLQAQQTPTSTSATTNPLAAMSPSSSMFAPTPTTSTTTYNASNWSTNPSLYTGGVPNQSYYTALSANTGVQLNPAAATAPSAASSTPSPSAASAALPRCSMRPAGRFGRRSTACCAM